MGGIDAAEVWSRDLGKVGAPSGDKGLGHLFLNWKGKKSKQ